MWSSTWGCFRCLQNLIVPGLTNINVQFVEKQCCHHRKHCCIKLSGADTGISEANFIFKLETSYFLVRPPFHSFIIYYHNFFVVDGGVPSSFRDNTVCPVADLRGGGGGSGCGGGSWPPPTHLSWFSIPISRDPTSPDLVHHKCKISYLKFLNNSYCYYNLTTYHYISPEHWDYYGLSAACTSIPSTDTSLSFWRITKSL